MVEENDLCSLRCFVDKHVAGVWVTVHVALDKDHLTVQLAKALGDLVKNILCVTNSIQCNRSNSTLVNGQTYRVYYIKVKFNIEYRVHYIKVKFNFGHLVNTAFSTLHKGQILLWSSGQYSIQYITYRSNSTLVI